MTWRWFGLYVTFVHELGHAYAALMTGRFVHGLRIGLDHSGRLVSSGRSAFGAAWSGFWGYPAPAVVGLGLIAAFAAGRSGAAMSIGALILLVSLIFLRNLTGILVAVVSAGVAQLLILFAAPTTTNYVVLALGVALSVGGVRDLFKLASVHTSRRDRIGCLRRLHPGPHHRAPGLRVVDGFYCGDRRMRSSVSLVAVGDARPLVRGSAHCQGPDAGWPVLLAASPCPVVTSGCPILFNVRTGCVRTPCRDPTPGGAHVREGHARIGKRSRTWHA